MSTDRRNEILAASAKLFAERGISSTTIREIGDASGLNSGTLYHYFTSKDTIASEIIVRFVVDLVDRYKNIVSLRTSARERVSQIVRASFESADRHPYSTEIYQNEFSNLSSLPGHIEIVNAVESAHQIWIEAIEDGIEKGEFLSNISPFDTQRMMRELVFMSVRWHRNTLHEDIDLLTQSIMTVFDQGFVSNRNPIVTTQSQKRFPIHSSEIADFLDADLPESIEDLQDLVNLLRSEVNSLRFALREIHNLSQTKKPWNA